MPPLPVCTVLDNPPDDATNNDIEDNIENVVHVIASSSDSEDESDVLIENGYQLLPQEPSDQNPEENENIPSNTQDNNVSQGLSHQNFLNYLPQRPVTFDETVMIWNEPASPDRHQPMDPEHAEKIKAAMLGFALPPSAVPPWAHLIPEEDWKAQLFANIREKSPEEKENLSDNDR